MQSLPEFLNKYKDYGGVVVNWMLFGSSGHVKRPPGMLDINLIKHAT